MSAVLALRSSMGGSSATLTTIVGPISLDSTDGGWGSYDFVWSMANANLLAGGSGCEITQVILQAPAGSSMVVSFVYVGHKASSGDAFDFQSTPVKFQVGGSDGTTITADSTATWTGSYALPSGADPMIAYETTSATHRSRAAQTGAAQYYKSGTGDAGTVNKAGYNTYTGIKAVLSIREIKALV